MPDPCRGGLGKLICGRIEDAVLLMGRVLRQDGRGSATDLRLAARVIEDAGGTFRPSAFEQAMGVMGTGKPRSLNTGASTTFLAPTGAGARSVYKPSPLECIPSRGPFPGRAFRLGIPHGHGHLAARDVGTYRLDEALGFGRVPPTGLLDGPFGRGSNQHWIFSTRSYPMLELARLRRHDAEMENRGPVPPYATEYQRLENPERTRLAIRAALQQYPRIQREQMAVLDYVIGNTDRHWNNFRTDRHGGIVAIDNTLSFPEFPDPIFGIRSDFVAEFRGVALSPEVVDRVRAVDPEMLRAAWADAGIGDKAITGALERLQEIRDHGMITGRAWPGDINGAPVDGGTAALPTGWIAT